MAQYYMEGLGITQNTDEAALWFENIITTCSATNKSKEQQEKSEELLSAMTKLGNIYCVTAITLDRLDEKTSLECCELFFNAVLAAAKENGDKEDQNSVAICYALGRGVQQDFKQAVEWYKKAADQGLGIAQFELGYMLSIGRGIAKDKNVAFQYFHKAALQGNADAQFELGLAYKLGHGVGQNQDSALFWMKKAADQDFAPARLELCYGYRDGLFGVPDPIEAFNQCNAAAELGLLKAQIVLAEMYVQGIGTFVDIEKATEILDGIFIDESVEYEPEEWNPIVAIMDVRTQIAASYSRQCCVIM